MTGAPRRLPALALGLLVLVMAAGTAFGSAPLEYEDRTLLDFIRAGGLPGQVIILLALAGAALVVACALKVRRGALLPALLVSKLEQALSAGDVEGARELCLRATALRNVLFGGLGRLDHGPEAAARAAHLATERERLALRRFAGWLLLIAVSAALIGAFGTVAALVEFFDRLAVSMGTVEGFDIPDSYSKALISSYMGLFVAIVLFPAWWFFSARAEMLAHEIEMTAEDLIARVRNVPVGGDQANTRPLETT